MKKEFIQLKNVVLSVNKELGITVVRDVLEPFNQTLIGNIFTGALEDGERLVTINIEVTNLESNTIEFGGNQ